MNNRTKQDWAITYVLDSAFGYFLKKNRSLSPDWYMQAVKGYDDFPYRELNANYML